MTGSLPLCLSPRGSTRGNPSLRWLALVLRSASRLLVRLSRALSATERARSRSSSPTLLEFYAEAGAPEGALYVNGKLVGYLPGVKRL